ncbi:hypothetical protein VRRI112168_14300 [Vreelandella rituensis]
MTIRSKLSGNILAYLGVGFHWTTTLPTIDTHRLNLPSSNQKSQRIALAFLVMPCCSGPPWAKHYPLH